MKHSKTARCSVTAILLLFVVGSLGFNLSLRVSAQNNTAQTVNVKYDFPWTYGDSWEYRGSGTGWHGTPLGLDIGTDGSNKKVLSAANGTIIEVNPCIETAWVRIEHADGVILDYLHIELGSLAPEIVVGNSIFRGQLIGNLKPGTFDDGDCGNTSGQRFNSAHLHWGIPSDGSFSVDGWTIGTDGIWKNGANQILPGGYLLSHNYELRKKEIVYENNFPWAWYYLIKRGDDSIRSVYLDGQLIFESPDCAVARWLNPGSHAISYYYEARSEVTPEIEINSWPWLVTPVCAADSEPTPVANSTPTGVYTTPTNIIPANGIQFCDASNYSAPCVTYTYIADNTCIALANNGMDNKIQSLKFMGNYIGNYSVILFEDNSCATYIARYGNNSSDLGGLNNITSSFRIEQLQPADCPTSPDGVTLYVNAGYQGHCHTFTPGSYPDLSQFQLDQNITSIKNPNGAFAVHFNDGLNFSGTPGHFDSDVYDLGPSSWSDRTRSAQIEKHIPTTCSPASDGAVLYVDVNYGSGCITVTSDIPDLSVYGFDHALDSLRFVGSYKNTSQILIYRQANYSDLCKAYWQDQSDLRECAGQAVSVRILPFTPPTPIPTQPGDPFTGNIAPVAFLYPYGTSSLVDGNLNTEWVGGHGSSSNVYLSWSTPVSINRVVVWDRAGNTGSNGINSVTLTFSDGTIATNIDMTSAGPRCAEIRFPDKTVTWVGVLPWDTSGDNGFREIEVWATTGQQYSDNSCVMVQNVTPQSASVSDPPVVATPIPGPTQPPITNLVVSTNPAESSDGQAHGANNPYIIPYNAQYDSVTIKAGAYASASAWNGSSGGVVRFTVTGTVLIEGTLTVDGKGYRGGAAVVGAGGGNQGESFTGYGSNSFGPNGGGGGGGIGADSGGGGGGYGSPGQNAQNGADVGTSYGGNKYGDPSLYTLYLGSGGGSSGAQSGNFGGAGGAGGGAIFIQANSIIVTGKISANGADGKSAGAPSNPRGGGGGSGGSILLRANSIDVGNGLATALGGQGGYGTRDNGSPASGGAGGVGRIRLEYLQQNPPIGTTNPPASVAKYVTTLDLVVSTNPSESSDGQSHGSSNPFIIPLDAAYSSMTIKAGAYASTSAWNGSSGGTVRFTVTGLVQIDGTLTVAGLGYRGGPAVTGAGNGKQGESYTGWGTGDVQPNAGGGGGGGGADSGGAGGGYGSQGQNAINGSDAPVVYGGLTYGNQTLTTLYLGSGGGSSGAQSANVGGAGGNGGGAISITAGQIIVSLTGKIIADGANGTSAGSPTNPRGGGGGSGGSIFLRANIVTINGQVSSVGGLGGYGMRENGKPAAGGNGGVGRIYIQFGQGITGSTSPAAYSQYDPDLEPAPTFTPSPTLTNTPTFTPTNTATATPTSTPTRTPTPTSTATDSCLITSGLWLAEYWNNEDLSGYPVRCLYTDSINFEWYSGFPVQGVASDHFSARWTRNLDFEGGKYQFDLFYDDGARLYVDNNLVVDEWCDNCRTNKTVEVQITPGFHTIKLEFREMLGWASIQLSWKKLPAPTPTVTAIPLLTARSTAARDGWVLEFKETTNLGGTMSSTGWLRVGDDAADKQYRSILYFNTAGLPDNATITKVTLKIKKYNIVGTDPFTTHSNLIADIRTGFFGTYLLQTSDFQATASKNWVGKFTAVSGAPSWYQLVMGAVNFPYINKTGVTQFRLRFTTDDNNDRGADYVTFVAGDAATASYRPTLIIEYTVP